MTEPTTSDDPQATLRRIVALVEGSHFSEAGERQALLDQLTELQQEITAGQDEEEELPSSLHEALQTTEVLAIKQLVTPPASSTSGDDDPELSWSDLSDKVKEHVSVWEANHPRLAVSLAKFNDVLAKLGI